MKLRLPHTLFRALMACFAAVFSSVSASASAAGVELTLPDVEQADSMLCWAASAADMLALETGEDAEAIYRSLTAASGNTPGYVETALSWYLDGCSQTLHPQAFDGSRSITRSGFASVDELAAVLGDALRNARAASLMFYSRAEAQGPGHAVTVYACEYEGDTLMLTYADSADGIAGLRRAAVVAGEQGPALEGVPGVIGSLTYLGNGADEAPAAPVGAYMHSSPLIQEYSDMAENRGVYRFGASPSAITYRNGEADYTLNVTPDFSSVADMGCFTVVNNGSFQLTVEHNGIMTDATFNARFVGDYAQRYSGVGIRNNTTFVFGWHNPFVSMNEDYKVERVSRLVTDSSSAYFNTEPSVLTSLGGQTIYRVGAGNSGWYDTQGNINWNVSAWGAGLTAGVTQLAGSYDAGNGVYNVEYSAKNYEICTPDNALPSNGQPGDSGSPLFIWNETQGRFEFVGPLQGASDTFWISRYNPSATQAAIDYCTVTFATSVDYNAQAAEDTTYYLSGAKVRPGDTLIEDGSAATYLRQGSISLGGLEVARFNGVALDEFSEVTWKKLDADSLTWYTYKDADYLNALPDVAQGADAFGTEDLFYTSNLHFTADADDGSATAHRRIELTDHVDLGVGHVQFSLGEGTTSTTYDIGLSSSDKFLSSAGFVVDKGVTLNNYFTYEKGRELRRVGAGIMNMVGEGNNDVLLNIGGGGITHLNRTNGYAAYSALVNNEAVLRLADAGQVYNNVTLGANGGVLDFNANDYRWTSGGARAEGSDGQTYFGLTVYEGLNRVETSTLANYAAGTTTTITIERGDNFEFAGAFRDGSTYTGSGSVEMDSRYTMMPSQLIGQYKQYSVADRQDSDSTLKVIYNGGGRMEMTGVYTLLTGNSGFEVASGTVSLHGTNTIHAIGSDSGKDLNRWQNSSDWHYAMAEMNVKVGSGSRFELGDHALLIGNVQVEAGGSFVMKQAVNERHEYVEGWYKAEDTYALSDYYGLKGNVNLAAGAGMTVAFDAGVATELRYGGNISGEGSLTVNAGEGFVHLTGSNSFSGEKCVTSGHLRLAAGAEGDTSTHKWKVEEAGALALDSVSTNAALGALVDASSTGVLALTQDFTEQVSLSGLIVGAAEGETVHYGTAERSLQPSGGCWTLGGGGGTLVVDFLLEGANTLVLGNEYGTGMVVLNNANNSFSGGIELTGKVSLGYTSAGALGNNVFSFSYGQTLAAMEGAAFVGEKIQANSSGVFALSNGAQSLDLSGHSSLSLGAHGEVVLTGGLSVAAGAAYRFGGAGSLTIATQLSGNHGILVDGQGGTGSRVTLAAASTDTGAVVVQGYDAAQASLGEVTLTFAEDNALANASSVTLRNNAGMDLNGTNQSFNAFTGDVSSLIFDDRGGNTLTLQYADNQTLNVRMQAAGTDVVKSGSGTLTLGGEHLWKSFSVTEGRVQVTNSKALGYLSSGSQGIAVNVYAGAALHVEQGDSSSNTFNVAGFGVDNRSWALSTPGRLGNGTGVLNIVGDAAISGQFAFKTLNLQGHELKVTGGISAAEWSAKGGSLVLDNASFKVHQGRFDGSLTIGAGGATIEYPWSDKSKEAFTVAGLVSGSASDSLLKLVGYNHTMNLAGGVALAGKVEVGNGLTLNITRDASVGAFVNEANAGDLSTVKVDAATLCITGSGNNFGSNGNDGAIELANGGQLQLVGLADGSSLGSLGRLKLGTDGVLSLSGFAGYTGSTALMNIADIEGTRRLQIDPLCLGELADGATYHLLTSSNELSGWTLLNSSVAGTRQNLELITGGSAGAYTLDLKVTGFAAAAIWQGTGALVAGQANAANISSTAGDNSFMAQDSLTISSEAGASDTLTLGGEIAASSVTYTGAGTLTLAQENGGKFAAGVDVVVDGVGSLVLGDTQAISGEIVLRQGSLSGSSTSLNGTEGVRVTGDAHFELTSATHVTAGINIEKGKSLTVSFKDNSMASQWGGNFDNNLSGSGLLKVDIGSGRELHLNGDHSAFIGDIAVQSGTLQLGLYDNGTLLGANLGASHISLASGTTLSLSSTATTLAADIDWAGGSKLHVKDGAASGVAYTLSGKQTLGGALTLSAAANKTVHISGDVAGTGSLNFTGGSTFILSGNNSYSGGTTLNNKELTLYASSANALGTGAVTGSYGRFVKSGASILTINDFSFTGATHVEQGTLALKLNNGTNSWSTGFSGDAGATLRLTTTSLYTALEGAMSGGMAVELNGHFQYKAANTHTGGTKLLSGSLLIGHANALQSGPLEAAKGTTVSVFSEGALIAGNSVVDTLTFETNSASLVVGTANVAGHLSFGSISGTNAGRFLLDIFSADSYDRLSGTLTPGSLLSVNLKASELGNYLLVEGDNSGFDTSTLSYSGETNSGHIYLWSSSERGITLSIQDASIAADANVWAGGSAGTWDASGAGWYGSNFDSNKKALFIVNDNTTISVAAAVTTTILEADVAKDVTLSFSPKNDGAITATTLQKDGAGTLSFAAGMSNSFSSVVVNEGMLSISAANGNPLGTTAISGNGAFELTGGSLRADLNAGAMAVKNIRLDGGALTLHSTAYWGTTISGRNIDIVGENSSLALEKWANLNASAVLLRDGGTIYTGNNGLGNDGGTIYVDNRGFIKAGNAGDGNLAADISGKGTLTIADWNGGKITLGGDIKDAEDGNLALVYNHNNVHINDIYDDQGNVTSTPLNTYSGGTTISGGSVTTYKETALGSGVVSMSGGSLTLAANLNIGSLSGSAGSIELGGNTLHINQVGAGAFAGNISGTGAVTKTGAGMLTLSGTNSVAAINLQAGRLVAASDGALSSGTVTFSAGTSLYVANNAKVSATLAGGNYLIGAEAGQAGSFTGNAAASLLASGFAKEGDGKVMVTNSTGQNPAGSMVVNAGTLAYDAGSSSTLGAVSGSGTFTLVGGAVNASNINVGKLVVDKSVLAYSSTFDGKVLEVSGQGSELRMGHWASVNNSTLLLKDGGRLSMSSSGFNNSTVTVEGSGTLAVGETASRDEKPILNVESSISGSGTLYVTDYSNPLAYTVNVNKAIADSAKGALAISTNQSDLHFMVANTYSGGTTITGGKLTAEVTGALGSGAVTINDGELVAKAAGSIGSGDVTMNGGKLTLDLGTDLQLFSIGNLSGMGGEVEVGQNTLIISQTENARFDGSISGSGSITKRGDATLELGGSVTTHELQLDSGTVKLVDSDVFANDKNMSSSVVTMNGGIFDINGQTSGSGADSFMFDVDSGFIDFVGAGDMLVKDSSGTAGSGLGFNAASKYAYMVVRHKGTGDAEIAADIVSVGEAGVGKTIGFSVQSTGNLLISGDIGADTSVAAHHQFGISKTGTGTMILSGNNGYTGGTTINGGKLTTQSASALGTGAVTITSGTLSAETTLDVSQPITFSGEDSMKVTGSLKLKTPAESSFIYSGTGAAFVESDIVNSANRLVFNVGDAAGKGADFVEMTVSGKIGTSTATSFGIDKNGAGTMKLMGANSFAWGFNLNEGRVIAASDSALGTGSIDVAASAVLEIAEGAHVGLTHRVNFADGSELCLHGLSTQTAALTTTGLGIGWNDDKSYFGLLTLTLASDIDLVATAGYKVLSLGTNVAEGINADRVSVNYLGDGRYTFTTRYESNTLYLDVTQDAAASLVWSGTAESGTWNQSSQNENWNTAGDTQGSNSFMNQDSVSFTEAADNKTVTVAESGVQVDKMTVSGADYSFSGGAVKAESVMVEQGASMNMGAVYTLAQKEAGDEAAAIGAVTLGSDSAKNTGYIHGAVAGKLSALDNMVIDIAKGATLELRDILLTDTSRITDDPATVAVENVTVALSEANAILEGASTLNIGTELVSAGGGASFVLTEAAPVVTVFSTALDTVNVTGTSLTIDLSGFESGLGAAWQENSYVAISFGQEAGSAGSLAHFDVTSGLSISATYGGSTYAVYVNKAEQGSAATLYVSTASDAIPEPTTATLSLLALSMLAARRRRK